MINQIKSSKLFQYIYSNRNVLLNYYIFLNFLGWTLYQIYSVFKENRIDYVEISFIVQNIVLTTYIFIRLPHKSIDTNWFHQAVAIVAFFSGAVFMGQTETDNQNLVFVSVIFVLIANLLGIITVFNLGKSFGILIAYRKVKSKGLYSLVRHPMYATDILLRIGFIISHLNLFTLIAFVLSTCCYIYRAILEEQFLSQQPEYKDYMAKVKYRFIPFIF